MNKTYKIFFLAFFIFILLGLGIKANSQSDTCAGKGLSDKYQSDVKSAANEYIASHPEIANQSSGSNLAAVAQLRDGTTAILIGRGFMARRILDPSGNPYPQMIGIWTSSDTDVTVYRVTAGGGIISQAIQAGYCGGHETFEGVDIGSGEGDGSTVGGGDNEMFGGIAENQKSSEYEIIVTKPSAKPGETVDIVGVKLSSNVILTSLSDKSAVPLTASVNGPKTKATITLPSDLKPGGYSLSIMNEEGFVLHPQLLTVNSTAGPAASLDTTPVDDFGELIERIFGWALNLVGIAVFVNFLWAGFLWFTAAGRPGPIGQAKEKMFNSLIGAIILLASYLILNTINPDLVKNTLRLPGLGTNQSRSSSINTKPGAPIPAASLLSDLQAERSKYGPTISHAEAGIILNAVAWKNRDAGWGLLGKPSGNNCPLNGSGQPISCDWLVHKPSGSGLDVFKNGPGLASNGQPVNGTATPQWGNVYPETNWIAPVQP